MVSITFIHSLSLICNRSVVLFYSKCVSNELSMVHLQCQLMFMSYNLASYITVIFHFALIIQCRFKNKIGNGTYTNWSVTIVRVSFYQLILSSTIFHVAFLTQIDCTCWTLLSNCFSFAVNGLNQKPPGRSMHGTDRYNFTWGFHEILILAWEVVFQVWTVVFLRKNIGFSTFLDFECYYFEEQRGTVHTTLWICHITRLGGNGVYRKQIFSNLNSAHYFVLH